MGFWHTGYMEFHEPEDLDGFRFEPSPPQFSCAHCGETYASPDQLRQHRFESHPLHRPTLFLRGQELGAHPVRITRVLTKEDVRTDGCDRAIMNGKEVSVRTLSGRLAKTSSGVCRLRLSKADISSEFTLDFRIASEPHLQGIEDQLERMALGRRLDIRAVEEFITDTSQFVSAIGYCDGICAYLYGVLAKERARESTLPYEAYVGKFSKAAEKLSDYDRPLARTIGSLIEFHFNHFVEAAGLAGKTRVGRAATRYVAWLQGMTSGIGQEGIPSGRLSKLETLVTDWETEQIARWAVRPLHELSRCVVDMESFLDRDIAEYDSVKLHVLLGETYAAYGDDVSAIKHAKTLRNLSALEKWADSMIQAQSEGRDDQY